MILRFLALLTGLFPGAVQAGSLSETPELVVYATDSLVAPGGLGPEIRPLFEAKCGCRLRLLPIGDSGQLLTRLQLDGKRGKTVAQVVLGVDQLLWERIRPWVEDWGEWRPAGYAQLRPETIVGSGFLPFDYGAFAFMADRQALKETGLSPPVKFFDLLQPRWKRRLLLEDPRTSTPGLAWMLYASQLAKDAGMSASSLWSQLRPQWLTLAPGWDSAYSLFLRKEAPLVWSYITSQAFHQENGGPLFETAPRYQAILLAEGQPMQVEGAALVKAAVQDPASKVLARSFLDFLISNEVQKRIPSRNWMLPARAGTELPRSFSALPRLVKIVKLPTDAATINAELQIWSRAVEGAP